MKAKFKFKAITYRGEKTSFLYEIDFPDDVDLIDWLDEHDKQYIINEKELICIIDYEVYVKKPRVKKKKNVLHEEALEMQVEPEDIFSQLKKILK